MDDRKMMSDSLYKMKLHEELCPNTKAAISIVRVPGGWIYSTYYDVENCGNVSAVFVPFHNEFEGDNKG